MKNNILKLMSIKIILYLIVKFQKVIYIYIYIYIDIDIDIHMCVCVCVIKIGVCLSVHARYTTIFNHT
jgi:hypothetical protein